MAREGFPAADGGERERERDRVQGYGNGRVTISVVVTCLMAASCGLIFGYDIGVSGGVTQMQSFLEKFFPEVLREMKGANRDAYCKFDNQMLTAFTSSLYIAGMLSSLVASRVTKRVGRQAVMLTGGVLFLAGSVFNAAALNITMLILVVAVEEARRNNEGAFERLRGKGYRHYIVMMVAIPAFFELTGMIVISVFSPVLFRTVGFNSQKAVLGSVILSLVNLSSVAVSTFVVDRAGRRFLFLVGGIAMMFCQVAVAWILAEHLGRHHATTMARNYAYGVLALTCAYTFSFGLSWGPLKWVVPSEIYPVEIRSAGQAMTIAIALTLSFAQTQVFITLLCSLKYAIFFFYAGWVLVMTIFMAALLPETKGVQLEAMRSVWAKHWYWRRFVRDAKQDSQVNCL